MRLCACVRKPWPQSHDPQNREVRQQRFAHFTELAIMSVQEIVDFAKQLPGFLELTREDQIALLKTSTIEVSQVFFFSFSLIFSQLVVQIIKRLANLISDFNYNLNCVIPQLTLLRKEGTKFSFKLPVCTALLQVFYITIYYMHLSPLAPSSDPLTELFLTSSDYVAGDLPAVQSFYW